jgi:glycerol-3-phosphate O-acyltransferase/dihydroxyacetone phosphate acyltransferase
MRSVLVSTTDYDTLQMIYTARRLYQRKELEAAQKQDLNRRFAEGYRRLLLMTDGSPPQEWLDLQDRLIKYRRELKELGLKDYQVTAITGEHLEAGFQDVDGDQVLSFLQLLYHIIHLLVLTVFASVPGLLLNVPVKILADLYAERRRKKALAKSKVKIHGYDVMLTEKVVFCLVMVPALWILYAVILIFFTKLDGPTISLIIMSFPLFAYLGIIVSEAGMVEWNDLRPYWMRVFPSTRRRLAQLPETRKKLQHDLRSFVKSIGPAMGDIYYGEKLDWKAIMERSRKEK